MNGKCPGCGESIVKLLGELVPVQTDHVIRQVLTWRCPLCNVLLGCEADPEATQREVKNAIDDAFRRRGML